MSEPHPRDLDFAIAEQLFGWRWLVSSWTRCRAIFPPGGPSPAAAEYWREPARGDEPLSTGCGQTLPRYAQDIAAAWLVVECLIAYGWEVIIESYHTPDGLHWEVQLCRADQDHNLCTYDRAAPLAICKAALAVAPHIPRNAVA